MRWSLAILLPACGHYETVEDACPKRLGGESRASAQGVAALERVNCHRRMAGVPKIRADGAADAAAKNHAAYMAEHGDLSLHEDESLEGYTGATVADRLRYEDYEFPEQGAIVEAYDLVSRADWAAAAFGLEDATPETVVDFLMIPPAAREWVLHPGWSDAGFAEEDDFAELVMPYSSQFQEKGDAHFTYPADGQQDAHTTWTPQQNWQDLEAGSSYGCGLTLWTGTGHGSGPAGDRPWEVEFATLEGPTGDVKFHQWGPGTSALVNSYAFIPLEPLEPDTEYTFAADLIRRGQTDERRVETTFKTRKE